MDILSSLSILDAILGLLFIFFITRGGIRGFALELGGVLGMVFGLLAASNATNHDNAVKLLQSFIYEPFWLNFTAFFGIFCTIFLIINLIARLVGKLITKAGFNLLDYALGMLAGFIKATVVSMLLLVILRYPGMGNGFLEESILAPHVYAAWNWLCLLVSDRLPAFVTITSNI